MRRVLVASVVFCCSTLALIGCGGSNAHLMSSTGTGNSGGTGGSGGGTGGGGGSTSGQQNAFLYISESTNKQSGLIEAFAIDESTGALTAVSGSPFATNTSTAGDLELSPNNTAGYLLTQSYPAGTCCVGSNSVQVYGLDDTSGAPSLKQTVAAGDGSMNIAVHPSGKFVYVSPWNRDNTGIGVFTVASDGTLTLVNTATAQAQDSAVITPDGKYLYTHTDGAPVGDWQNTSACGPVTTNLWAYSIDASSGALTQVSGSPFTFQRQLCYVGHQSDAIEKQIDPSGKNLYLVDEANSQLLTFAIDDATGALTQSGQPMSSGFSSSVIDPRGPYLYVGGVLSFTGYNIGGSTPALIPGMPVSVPPVPADNETGSTTMAVDPSGTYLFSNENGYTSAFSCCDPDGLVEFKIDAGTGALTQTTATPSTLQGTASRIVATNKQ